MNYKNLNYEIETNWLSLNRVFAVSMNYKNLNYEIETGCEWNQDSILGLL